MTLFRYRHELNKWFATWPVKLENGRWAWLRIVYKQHIVRIYLGQFMCYEDKYYEADEAVMLMLRGVKVV